MYDYVKNDFAAISRPNDGRFCDWVHKDKPQNYGTTTQTPPHFPQQNAKQQKKLNWRTTKRQL